MFKQSKLDLGKWLSILPGLAALVGYTVDVLRDGRVTADEAQELGARILAIVRSVMD